MEILLVLIGGAAAIGLMVLAGRYVRRSGAMPLVGEAYLLATGTRPEHGARPKEQLDA